MKIREFEAQSLIETGYIVLSGYRSWYSIRAQDEFRDIVECFGPELHRLCFMHEARPDGVYEPDDGFVNWVDEKTPLRKDMKRVFHYRPDLASKIERVSLKNEFHTAILKLVGVCRELFLYHQSIVLELAAKIDACHVLPRSIHQALSEAQQCPLPTSRSVLRLIQYQPYSLSERGKLHYDRSLLTLHAGDRGGWLYRLDRDGREVKISPWKNEILVFWGCKARAFECVGSPALEPLAHGSRCVPDGEREAVVSFWHSNEILYDAPSVPYQAR